MATAAVSEELIVQNYDYVVDVTSVKQLFFIIVVIVNALMLI